MADVRPKMKIPRIGVVDHGLPDACSEVTLFGVITELDASLLVHLLADGIAVRNDRLYVHTSVRFLVAVAEVCCGRYESRNILASDGFQKARHSYIIVDHLLARV